MSARRAFVVAFAVVLAVTVVAGASALGVVSAGHGEPDADYTVEPMNDRSPGATDVKYGQIVVAQAGVDFETLEEMEAVYEEGSWASCGAGDGEVFGIDRGNTHDGYETDEDLEENTKTFSAGEDVFRIEFYGENDFGPSTHLNDGDAVVSVAECIDNPDEPGWYQISGSTTGVTEDGERVTVGGESHYFWICECEDEEAAREQLGPPPSEEGSESDADETGGSDEEAETESGSESDGSGASGGSETPAGDGEASDESTEDAPEDGGSGESTDEDAEASETETPAPEGDGGDGTDEVAEDDATAESGESTAATEEASSPATTEETGDEGNALEDDSRDTAGEGNSSGESWDSHVVQTPTPGDGAGFGVPAALAALAVAALLARRR